MSNQFSPIVNPPYNPIQENTTRFSSAQWFDNVRTKEILVAGVGGIGSWLALMISRLNPDSIKLVDDDTVEPSNMAGQFFNLQDLHVLKVEATKRNVEGFSAYYSVSTYNARVDSNSQIGQIVLCGFDNMQARKATYEAWKRCTRGIPLPEVQTLFMDGRLSAETLQIFCFTRADTFYMQEYEDKWLFSDEEAESTVCSYKQTSYCANLIASLMTNLFVNWCTNQCNPLIDRSLPFMTEYSAEQMFLKTVV